MSILDNILGGGSGGGNSDQQQSSSNFSSVLGTDPQLGLHASDVLHSQDSNGGSGDSGGDSSSFTGIGDLGVGFAAPTVVGIDSSHDQSSMGNHDGGGLLGGLL